MVTPMAEVSAATLARTLIVSVAVEVPKALAAETGTRKTPAVVGVPVIDPEPVSRPRPGGRLLAPKLVGVLVAASA